MTGNYPPEKEGLCEPCDMYKDLYDILHSSVYEDEYIKEILNALSKDSLENTVDRKMDDQKYEELLGSLAHDLLKTWETMCDAGVPVEYANTIGGEFLDD